MTFFLLGDEFATDPVWPVLAEGKSSLVHALKAGYVDLGTTSSHHGHDGYLTQYEMDQHCTKRVQVLLTMSVLGLAPKIHRRGDECECLGEAWIDGFGYRIHKFLKRNPSRKEKSRNDTQKAELNSATLKHAAWMRDGGCCRYCRSGVLNKKSGRFKDRRRVLHFDHVDPDQTAGDDLANFVTSCARCNEYKGRRTPEEADMRLLPVPTAEEIAAWAARGPAVFDLPLYGLADQLSINAGSTADQQQAVVPPVVPPVDPRPGATTGHHDQTRAQPGPQTTDEQQEQPVAQPAKGPGRVGQPRPGGAAPAAPPGGQPARTPDAPDIYHRRSRAAPPAAVHPTDPEPPEGRST
jgi:hypothetical protein